MKEKDISIENGNRLMDYLNYRDWFPDDTEMQEIIDLAVLIDSWQHNKGYKFERTEHNLREKAFYEQWLKENYPQAGINYGQGILQDLFIEQDGSIPFAPRRMIEEITNRDRYIVATVIQWLGTNVGMSFLHEALRRFGATIIYNQQSKE